MAWGESGYFLLVDKMAVNMFSFQFDVLLFNFHKGFFSESGEEGHHELGMIS